MGSEFRCEEAVGIICMSMTIKCGIARKEFICLHTDKNCGLNYKITVKRGSPIFKSPLNL